MEIISEYIGVNLAVDLLGWLILVIYLSCGIPALIYLKIFFYVTLLTVLEIDSIISTNLELKLYAHALYRLIKLEVVIVFIVFWLSAIFFAIDYSYYKNGQYTGIYNWLTNEQCTTGVTQTG